MRIVGIALFLFATSCHDALGPEQRQIHELETARGRWQAQNIHTYAFTLQRTCFCGDVGPLYVAVVADAVVGVLDLNTGEFIDPAAGETVEQLFAFIESAIDHHAELIRAEYDRARGFPTEIDYDGSRQAHDDEISFQISDVHPIAPQTSP